ncbi:MAG: DUF362 domain-containing protein [Candidatus Scalindua sp.]|mgnify:FL=1|jgi:uncharacterized protein (DUF362 family)|nr:DUF362 domain-containing protein [Candidatus Scalindua sp.]MBT5307045.1 DUF362 domain-containing protein [Candidatus Scalindua sp.]MBT6230673.1 DUF362 domain-containing protein [Candidatus Scalindua sp.]MBT6564552.1 DUF362 domain-containing protein [Candidatus Scalindua sp.]MBT7211564.1 DUF362 domain-containing protein [Candidatus Scalindua sp.]
MSKDKTRREFIKETCFNSLVGGMFLSQIPLPLDPLPDDTKTDLKQEKTNNLQSLVVDVKSSSQIIKGMTPNLSLVKQMMDSGITSLTGKDDPKDAWKSLFHEDERIGIKINALGADILAGNYQICWAIVDALKSIGVKENNIIIWEQYQHFFLSSGFKINRSFKGVRTYTTDGGGGKEALDSGSSHREYDSGYGAVKISRILTEEVDSLINLGLLKDHGLAGVSIALKNISHGVISHPDNFHDNACDPFIAAINSIPVIKDKIKLHICNGIVGLYDGGPMPQRRNVWNNNGIILSRDPVALDTIGMHIIEKKRKEKELVSLFNRPNLPVHIETAAEYGLGVSDLNLINHKAVLI